jgi:ATP-dependent HslUV protease subunit HslV
MAMIKNTKLPAEKLVKEALNIAADICIYTNRNQTIETLDL